MDDVFTAALNRLLEDVEPHVVFRPKYNVRLQQSLFEQIASELAPPRDRALAGTHYCDWSDTRDCDVDIASFSEARKMIIANRGNARTLARLRRVIALRLHPDVVPKTFAGEADELMKTMNAYFAEARQAS